MNLASSLGMLCVLLSLISSSQAQTDYSLKIVRPKVTSGSGQRFLCAAPYTLPECSRQITILQAALGRYGLEDLGPWTWVLVPSADWSTILERFRLAPDSPAFTSLEQRQTFLEEALLVPKPGRQRQLIDWAHMSFEQLLDHALSHELAHALCNERDEIKAERIGRDLSKEGKVTCPISNRRKFAAAH